MMPLMGIVTPLASLSMTNINLPRSKISKMGVNFDGLLDFFLYKFDHLKQKTKQFY